MPSIAPAMASHRCSTVPGAAFLSQALIFGKAIPTGLKPGPRGGGNRSFAPNNGNGAPDRVPDARLLAGREAVHDHDVTG